MQHTKEKSKSIQRFQKMTKYNNTWMVILKMLSKEKTHTKSNLMRKTMFSYTAINNNIDGMLHQKWVKIKQENTKREKHLILTQKGESIQKALLNLEQKTQAE